VTLEAMTRRFAPVDLAADIWRRCSALNHALDQGGVQVSADGSCAVDAARIGDNVTGLARGS
jgi:hypothetical protein